MLKSLIIETRQTVPERKPLVYDNTTCSDSRNNFVKAAEQTERWKLRANKRIPKKEYLSSEGSDNEGDADDDDDGDKDDADCFETDFLV